MKIVVDAFGGDNAPQEIVKGAVAAINAENGFELVLCGKEQAIKDALKDCEYDADRISILDADEVISNNESPTEAIRKKKTSSIVVGLDYLNTASDAEAFVSAGSTGAVLTGAVLLLKRIRGINRPALVPVLPTVQEGKDVLLVDCGANTDCKPLNIVQFAYMGKAYAKAILGIQNPRIGLLSNGTEDKKGNELNKTVFPMLKEKGDLNFVGNLEARDILSANYDVIVSDGFDGNIALKSCEGTALTMLEIIKQNIMAGGLRAKIGYLLLKPVFKKVKKTMDYNGKGGAVLLGLTKTVVKAHGSSKAKAITAAVLQAKHLVDKKVVKEVEACFDAASV